MSFVLNGHFIGYCKTDGAVVGNILLVIFLRIGHIFAIMAILTIMTKRQTIGTTAVVREFTNSLIEKLSSRTAFKDFIKKSYLQPSNTFQ